MSKVSSIYRYPVKGLSGDLLPEVMLTAGKGVPHDRQFAIALGDTHFDPANPEYLGKRHFLMLMVDAKLAELSTAYNASENILTILKDSAVVYSGRLDVKDDADRLGTFFDDFMNGKTRGGARLVTAEGHMFADIPDQNVSLINLASVRDFEDKTGLVVDPMRFRGNIYIDDMPAWSEFDLVGKSFKIGEAEFKGKEVTTRCAAVNVNLETAARDMNIPLTLKKTYGHSDMGIYADVIKAGVIKPGDKLELL
ncbi:MOSC domain-containing protein [Kordiimonas pumila]|uniref:MOSC domain-containing protein n=1 Tax=Kordiimonas pumila TaxID=2161677 RepID=A0ABV7D9G3_9PROT|nr:MOSC domain-containing protein [Kordiimonas pumila]